MCLSQENLSQLDSKGDNSIYGCDECLDLVSTSPLPFPMEIINIKVPIGYLYGVAL